MSFAHPTNPIAAVTHPNPYPYYAELATSRALYRDEALGIWIASSAATVSAVLASDLCRVRPLTELVPVALLGSAAGDLFGQLVRMNDGTYHDVLKQAVVATLHAIKPTHIVDLSRRLMYRLSEACSLQEVASHLSVYVIATLLGVPDDELHQTAQWMAEVVRCIAPASTSDQIETGKIATGHMFALFRHLRRAPQSMSDTNLLATLAEQAQAVGITDEDTIIANAIGFMSQAYEATAGLIGNTLVTLRNHPRMHAQVRTDDSLLPHVIQEVLRYDPPVQNTRRFVARAGLVAGQYMQASESILVVLAAANRDSAANPDPDRFDPHRTARRIFTFGYGNHACPGEILACLIAQAGIESLLATQADLSKLFTPLIYRPSANTRVALLPPHADERVVQKGKP